MKRVSKNDFIKAMNKFGIEPLVDTWEVRKECSYDRFSGTSECDYEYFINSKCGLVFNVYKQGGCEPDVTIKLSDRNKYEQVNDMANYLEKLGYDNVDIMVNNAHGLIDTTIKTIKENILFDEELNYIIDYIKSLNRKE